MIPKRIVLENFLSFGEPGVEICFDDSETLWVLGGPNGIGKSSVFDAITYSLFGCHRGSGRQDKDKERQLIRHGANGFRVEFEFGFAGHEYKVIRNYVKKGVEKVFKDGEELDLSGGKNKVRDWAEQELGLTYEQFIASVLLKQGEADKIITGSGQERLQMLKQIIGVERYEELSGRVRVARNESKSKLGQLTDDLDQIPEVRAEERTEAERKLAGCRTALDTAQEGERVALTRVEQAKQWAKLDADARELDGKLREADDRQAQAAAIRQDAARLAELSAVVPTLKQLVDLRDKRVGAEEELAALRTSATEWEGKRRGAGEQTEAAKAKADLHRTNATAAADAVKELTQKLKDDGNELATAREVAAVDEKLKELPADLDERLKAAETAARAADLEAKQTGEKRAALGGQLDQREHELKAFETVEIGAKCSRCLQPVSAEHAERERNELHAVIRKFRAESSAAKDAEAEANARAEEAKKAHDLLRGHFNTRDKLKTKLLTLTRLGSVAPVEELTRRIAAQQAEHERQSTVTKAEKDAEANAEKDRKQADAERQNAERELTAVTAKVQAAEKRQLEADARREALAGTLTDEWKAKWEPISAAAVRALADEQAELNRSGVIDRAKLLQQDDTLRADWEQRRAKITAEIDALPPEARVSVAEATSALTTANTHASAAAESHKNAQRECDDQSARIARRKELADQLKQAEVSEDRHAKLDKLLGADGLLRDLVRSAERQIVQFANETVRNLSDGDLTIELDDAEEGPDKAFTLKVRRAEDSTPIGVHYLSGSQKFRVAVSVALAIGRFATTGTQAKPLECVIIDEGFGSLDKDGLRHTAEELNRLKQYLKRIILVSHQEEFTDHFPVVIQLNKGENGTTATAVRR